MSTLAQVIFFSLIGGVVSLIGGFLLLANKKRARVLATYATPFAAGALLAAAFMDLLREAAQDGSIEVALVYALIGVLLFFLLESFLRWFHHHHEHEDTATDPTASLIIIGDTLHNFIDGIAIAAGFLVNPSTGIVVTLAVAAHEIPQEIGDFGLLLKKGLSRTKVIAVNVGSALATTIAAIVFFQLGQSVEIPIGAVLGLVAGFFIYIAASDIIPSIHENEKSKLAGWQSAMVIFGAIIVSMTTTLLHSYIDTGNHVDHEHVADTEEVGDDHAHELYEYQDHDTLPTITAHIREDAKSGWNLELETTNFTFTPEEVNAANVPGAGHAHLYINGEKIARLYGSYFHIDKLNTGDEVRVTLNANDHSEYGHDGVAIDDVQVVGEGHTDHTDSETAEPHNHN